MSDYFGKSRTVRVRIISETLWRGEFTGQECDAIIYEPGINPQINTEQLTPPQPKWQSCKLEDIEVIG